MKLGKVTHNDPVVRQSLSLHKSSIDQLAAYQAYYKSVHGDEISMSQLVEEMTKRFMKEDRDFVKFIEAATKAASPAKAAPAATPAATSAAPAPARTLGLKA